MTRRKSIVHDSSIKKIQTYGFNIEISYCYRLQQPIYKLKCPYKGILIKQGTSLRIAVWLCSLQHVKNHRHSPRPAKIRIVETPPFRRNAILCLGLWLVLFMPVATFMQDHSKEIYLMLALAPLGILGVFNAIKHFRWFSKFSQK